MDLIQVVILALVQGLTEFLPISSSAHLILPKEVLGWPDQGLGFDVAVHVGTLLAVLIYFRQDIIELTQAWFRSVFQREHSAESRLAWYVIVGTIPAGLAGLVFSDFIENHLRSAVVIMVTTIVFGLVLGFSDWFGKKQRTLVEMTLMMAVVIGIAQALALIPGTSRSGITMTMALLVGLNRDSAARFSFLLSIPIIALSGGYEGLKLLDGVDTRWDHILVGVLVSGLSAYICIYFFLQFIQRIGMMPFVIYRLLLGLGLALVIW